MGRSRKHELDGEQVERLLAGAADASRPAEPLGEVVRVLRDAGLEPPSEAVAARHLAAIHAEVRRPSRPSTAAAPHRTPVRALIPRRLTAGVAGLTSVVALAFAGALPGVVQAAASDVLDVVGL
ncbi:MAG: hypothetical protein JWO90_771, partial [Solirubrobacterales bacterium]|nr:hypothetical protein [Solirubrobacterales bacterium]